jgi:hypothetical protein
MIYSVSKLELEQFKNSIHVARAAHLSRHNSKHSAEWNWLKQRGRGSHSARERKGCPHSENKKAPGSLRGLLIFAARYWLSSGMVLWSFGFGIDAR